MKKMMLVVLMCLAGAFSFASGEAVESDYSGATGMGRSKWRVAVDAGEMVQNAFIVDRGFYFPAEVQYHFGNAPFALMGGVNVSTHRSLAFDAAFSAGARWYTLRENNACFMP